MASCWSRTRPVTVHCGILNMWRAKVRRTGHSLAVIFFPPLKQGGGAAMPGMTPGIGWSQCPGESPQGSVVPTGKSLFSSRFRQLLRPSVIPSLQLVSFYNGLMWCSLKLTMQHPRWGMVEAADGQLIHFATSPMPAGQARCQNKLSGMAVLTFAFREQALGEGGSNIIFCKPVTRWEATLSMRGVCDHICPCDFVAIPDAFQLIPSTWISPPAEPTAMSQALAMLPFVSAGLNTSCQASLSPCQDCQCPQGSSPMSGRVEWGTAAAGMVVPIPPSKRTSLHQGGQSCAWCWWLGWWLLLQCRQSGKLRFHLQALFTLEEVRKACGGRLDGWRS